MSFLSLAQMHVHSNIIVHGSANPSKWFTAPTVILNVLTVPIVRHLSTEPNFQTLNIIY